MVVGQNFLTLNIEVGLDKYIKIENRAKAILQQKASEASSVQFQLARRARNQVVFKIVLFYQGWTKIRIDTFENRKSKIDTDSNLSKNENRKSVGNFHRKFENRKSKFFFFYDQLKLLLLICIYVLYSDFYMYFVCFFASLHFITHKISLKRALSIQLSIKKQLFKS